MEIKEIIRELEYFRGYYPEEALREAINRKEEISPELIKMLKKSIVNISYIVESTHNFGYSYAFYLLAQFRDKSAFPLITEFFSILEGNSYNFTGDMVTEALARILASVFNGELTTLNFVSTSDKYDEYVRVAYLDTYIILYKNEKISREELIDGYQYIFEELERKKSYLWYSLIDACTIAGISEFTDKIKLAYKDNLVDANELPYDQTMNRIETGYDGDNSFKKTTLIDDVIKETNCWSCFQKKQEEHSFYAGMPVTAKEIIKELVFFRGYYPAEALAKAAENKDVIIPELLKLLDWTSENPDECKDVDFIGPILACYLLGQFQEKSAFPTIIRFITSGISSNDAIFEFTLISLGEILASCYNGDHSLLTENILNKEVPADIRSAFLDCFIIIYKYNEIGKKEYFAILKRLFDNLEKDAEPVWNNLIEACKLAQAKEFYPEIELAYQANLVSEYIVPFEETRKIINNLDKQPADLKWMKKFDAEINTTDWWECIELEEYEDIELSYLDSKKYFFRSQSNDSKIDNVQYQDFDEPYQPMQPFVREGKKIGRNDPCPCGSGKKYKKCCGKNN